MDYFCVKAHLNVIFGANFNRAYAAFYNVINCTEKTVKRFVKRADYVCVVRHNYPSISRFGKSESWGGAKSGTGGSEATSELYMKG
jgi:hypothetical protein